MNNLSGIKALILDMDGVLWRDATPIGDLPSIFERIRARGLKFAMATNNASKAVDEFIEKFARFGVTLEPWQIITSSLATAHALAAQYPDRGKVFVIGGNGIQSALREQGFEVLTNPEDETTPLVVAVGIDWNFSYSKLRRAALQIRAGAAFYGTNPDKTFPTPQGLAPGAGSLLAALEAATDTAPIVIGKPGAAMMRMAFERLGTQPIETLVVGDRLETDIAAGKAAGCRTALVLSGVATRDQVQKWQDKPDIVCDELKDLI